MQLKMKENNDMWGSVGKREEGESCLLLDRRDAYATHELIGDRASGSRESAEKEARRGSPLARRGYGSPFPTTVCQPPRENCKRKKKSRMPRANNVGNVTHDELFLTDPEAYQMYQSGQHVYSAFPTDGAQEKYQFLNGEEHEESLPQDEVEEEEDSFLKNLKPGPNGFQEIPLELAQNYFDITELEDQACSSTGRTKFRMMINGQEMIIDGTVTPASEYVTVRQEQQTPALEDEEESMEYSVMHLPEAVLSGGQSMQMITLPDGQLALQVTQIEQKPQMAQVVTVDEEGNILSTDGTFAINMPSSSQGQGAVMMSMQTDEFGNMYLQEEPAPSTSGVGNFHCMEVTGDPAEIAAMYPGMQMLAVNPDGTLESVFEGGLPPATAETTYVNAKQYHRIMKRREARARLEASGRVPKIRSKYLHESRHRHACNRVRGEGGKFNSRKGLHINDGTDSDQSPMKIVKTEIESSPDKRLMEEKKEVVPLLPKPAFSRTLKTTPALKARNSTPLNIRSTTNSQPRPTAVITHLPLPPQSKARPPGFRAARPSEIKKLLPTTYSKPGSTISKVETLPDKILEESPSNSNSPNYPSDIDAKPLEESDFSQFNVI